MMELLTTPIPVAEWIEWITNWLTTNLSGLFDFLTTVGNNMMNGMVATLTLIPPLIFIAIIAAVIYYVSRGKIGLTIFSIIGLLFVYNQQLWNDLLFTLTLVIFATLISILLGIPLGIWMSKSTGAEKVIKPILDFMQTMPSFVYLIPAVAFFGIGMVPGVFASVIFALPPTVRFTNLGIRQVPGDLTEASDAFGSTGWQKLFKLELPLAKDTIFAGINQTTMLALSMVVTASMIGAPGLGEGVLRALQRAEVGNGFVNGLALVILAIVIDRFTQNVSETDRTASKEAATTRRRITIGGVVASLLFLIGGTTYYTISQYNTQSVSIASVQWDSEIASANVLKLVLEDMGYDVEVSDLDPAIVFSSIANGSADVTIAPWLPTSHGSLYEEYGDRMVNLGVNLEGAQNGIIVPAYMDIDSIEDLTTQANQQLHAIEPGAGITELAMNLPNDYPNLSDWDIITSSTGAMITELEQAINNGEEFVAVGWRPHWKFERYDIKMLEDPEATMGEAEEITSFAREGLQEDMPDVYHVVDNFNWELDDMQGVMTELQDIDPEIAAQNWIDANQELVESWKP